MFLVSRNIVNSHGGHIDVRSEFGVGSTFYFELDLFDPPPRESSVVSNDPSYLEMSPPYQQSTPTPKETIQMLQIVKYQKALVVDDSQMNRRLLKRLLSKHFESIDEVSPNPACFSHVVGRRWC
jgi:hypothetical protein